MSAETSQGLSRAERLLQQAVQEGLIDAAAGERLRADLQARGGRFAAATDALRQEGLTREVVNGLVKRVPEELAPPARVATAAARGSGRLLGARPATESGSQLTADPVAVSSAPAEPLSAEPPTGAEPVQSQPPGEAQQPAQTRSPVETQPPAGAAPARLPVAPPATGKPNPGTFAYCRQCRRETPHDRLGCEPCLRRDAHTLTALPLLVGFFVMFVLSYGSRFGLLLAFFSLQEGLETEEQAAQLATGSLALMFGLLLCAFFSPLIGGFVAGWLAGPRRATWHGGALGALVTGLLLAQAALAKLAWIGSSNPPGIAMTFFASLIGGWLASRRSQVDLSPRSLQANDSQDEESPFHPLKLLLAALLILAGTGVIWVLLRTELGANYLPGFLLVTGIIGALYWMRDVFEG